MYYLQGSILRIRGYVPCYIRWDPNLAQLAVYGFVALKGAFTTEGVNAL